MEVIRSSVLPLVLKAVIELEVLDIIAKEGPGAQLSASEIASRLPPSAAASGRNPDAPEMLDRMLRFLASHSILTCSAAISSSDDSAPTGPAASVGETRVYGLAPVAKYFVPDQDGVSLAYLLFMSHDKVHINSCYELKGAVLEGGTSFERVHGMHAFEYGRRDLRFNEVFNKAMQSVSKLVIKKIVHSYKGFEPLQSLVDVGGGLDAPEMLDRMLRFLASHSILTCSVAISSDDNPMPTRPAAPVGETRMYGLAPGAKYFVPDQDGGYELKAAVLEGGIPFERAHGMNLFEYCGKDARFNELFNKTMQCFTKPLIKKIVDSYKGFEQLQSLFDVGGGLGVSLSLITAKYPHIKAINFDLPRVIQQAPPYSGTHDF
ncbi:hypothetical protein RHSIM_Rhsim08G0116700 [Rhododendron simsii]|uniref:Caffeic acid O-methyltransferase n=1 Tax=Rhododendron simsii TaxID=118357 RepID=A0A834GNI9_RHOSS|nr:hypothetical protein RHSIM_Rhsim08G0116700 [Rhododendron simsii]